MTDTVDTDLLIRQSFAFLAQDLGFEVKSSHDGQRESSVTFCSPLARVIVHVDYLPLGVSVGVGLFVKKGQRTMVDDYGLVDLVRDRAPEEAHLLAAKVVSLAQALGLHAEFLRRHAGDILRAEQTRIPRLRRLRAAEIRRENKESFGTSTGETPRFSGRPTLQDLFADLANEGVRTPRVYQAFWDYAYPLAEIGQFLGVREDEVQAMLDDWDQL